MSALTLARSISMPNEVLAQLRNRKLAEHAEGGMAFLCSAEAKSLMQQLTHRESANSARADAQTMLAPDPDGFNMLYFMLSAACWTEQQYRRIGIPNSMFIDTMACFTRFTEEHRKSYGRYGFDRDFWTIRQLSVRLFRLGELEFELAELPEDVPREASASRVINMHIPSDAHIDEASCTQAVARLHDFLQAYFPDWLGLPLMCESWLLSPALPALLPEHSRIVQFQHMFTQVGVHEAAQDWREFVFNRNPAPVQELPENTTLQRHMKRFLLNGGRIGVGIGLYRDAHDARDAQVR